MKAIGRLFADMGDSYVELIATGMYLNLVTKPLLINCMIFAPYK